MPAILDALGVEAGWEEALAAALGEGSVSTARVWGCRSGRAPLADPWDRWGFSPGSGGDAHRSPSQVTGSGAAALARRLSGCLRGA